VRDRRGGQWAGAGLAAGVSAADCAALAPAGVDAAGNALDAGGTVAPGGAGGDGNTCCVVAPDG